MNNKEQIISFPLETEPTFKMINVGRKRPTRRVAIASGSIFVNQEAFDKIKTKTMPKGDVLAMAEVSGIMGSKNTPDMLPMCHPLPLDQVTIHCTMNEENNSITVYCQAVAFAKTGVEMEALAGVNAALLTIWDLSKGVYPALKLGEVSLLVKTGGKSGVWINPNGIPDWLEEQVSALKCSLTGKKIAVTVMSDRASKGDYEDKSGPVLIKFIEQSGAELADYIVIPDDAKTIANNISKICREKKPDLLIASGGTGPGPRDVTPDVLEEISDRMLDGFGDLLRTESLHFTDTAWLSRMTAGMVGSTLVIAFPGSPKAVQECLDIISPFLDDALNKIAKQGFV